MAVTVLLLDEVTSELDNENENIVQVALADLMLKQKLTHRRSTIHTVGKIAVVLKSVVLQEGTHEELLGCHDVYHRLVP